MIQSWLFSIQREVMKNTVIEIAYNGNHSTHLPIVADPSHGTGRRDKVVPMARAAVAAGADGLLIEVHPDPDRALSDGAQSLRPDQFEEMMAQLKIIAPAVGRSI